MHIQFIGYILRTTDILSVSKGKNRIGIVVKINDTRNMF